MENNGNDGDAVDEVLRSTLIPRIEELRNNTRTHLWFGQGCRSTGERWTIHHARRVVDALRANNSVVFLEIELHCCTIPAIRLFLAFIQSTPRIEKLDIYYSPDEFGDSREIRDQYETLVSNILDSVQHNPSIKKLSLIGSFGNNPKAIYDLLANTTTLERFKCESQYNQITTEIAFAVAGGLSRNSSLEDVNLAAMDGRLHIALAGIGFPSTIESLSVCQEERTSEDLYLAISKVLYLTPSLKTLEVGNEEHEANLDFDAPIDQVFAPLQQSPCTGLEKLVLNQVCFGDDLSDIASIENANHSLQILDLRFPQFSRRRSVRQLWNFVGLKKLFISNPSFGTDGDDDDDDEEEEDPDCWAEFIRRNKTISEVDVVDDGSWEQNCAMGIVHGAYGHESLRILRLCTGYLYNGGVNERVGVQLGRLVRGTKTLQSLTVKGTNVTPDGARQLAEAVFHSASLESFGLPGCRIDSHSMTTTLERFLTNQTLKKLDLTHSVIAGGNAQTVCRILHRVFETSTLLSTIHLPMMNLNAANMGLLVRGLIVSKTMKFIDFKCCNLDHAAWVCLEQALRQDSPRKMSISSIELPLWAGGERIVKPFLRSLPHMPNIKEATMFTSLDAEANQLLLQAAKDNKKLISFTRRCRDKWSKSLVEYEIDFYFKLNRFGRQILDNTNNVRLSLWPLLLARMTRERQDADALYFFLREYFANYSGGGNQESSSSSRPRSSQQRQQRVHLPEQSSRPSKSARLD